MSRARQPPAQVVCLKVPPFLIWMENMDIVEFAERYIKDEFGEGFRLFPWQIKMLEAFERGETHFLARTRVNGLKTVEEIATAWQEDGR